MKYDVDLLIKDVQVYNSYFKKFRPANVSVLNGKFYYIDLEKKETLTAKKELDGNGMYMIPGLIDIHMHIESSMMVPKVFCDHVASCGVTTIVSEPHEIANVNGIRGILDMIESAEDCPIDIFYGIPSCVPSTNEDLETTGGVINCKDMQRLMQNESILCVGEIMNYRQIIKENDLEIGKFLEYLNEKESKIVIEGHCPDLIDLDLAKFLFLGIDGDHTEHDLKELQQRFENGMYVELQEKMLTKEVIGYIKEHNLYEYFGFVTDDVMADTLYEHGQLDAVVRKAITLGMDTEQAIYNATYTNAKRMNLLERGVIAPGKKADFVLLQSKDSFDVMMTYKSGNCIYNKDKKQDNLVNKKHTFKETYYHSIQVEPIHIESFAVQVSKEQQEKVQMGFIEVRAMEVYDGSTKTKERRVKLPVVDGFIQWENSECKLAMVVERYGKKHTIGYGLICGDTIKVGAVATSYAHDSHNLLVVGNTALEMQMAINKVIEMQGGMVTVCENEITAALQLNVGGILSEEPIEVISKELKKIRQELMRQGYQHYNPIMSLCTLTLPVSPELKLTDRGLVSVSRGEIVSLIY